MSLMTHEHQHASPHPFAASKPTSLALLLRPIAVGLGMAVAFVTIFLSALHGPHPTDLPVASVGTGQQASGTAQALQGAAPGPFDVRSYETAEAAAEALRSREVYGVLDLSPEGSARILYAGAKAQV